MKKNWFAISALVATVAVPVGMLGARAYAAPAPAAFHFYQDRAWDQPPDGLRDVQRQGFHDGVEAARDDFDHHHHKNADDHDRFRHPPVDRAVRDDYRDGFRKGYDVAMHHMHEDHDHDGGVH